MLDKDRKDHEASVELLEDRKKQSAVIFVIMYAVGAFMALSFFLIAPISWTVAECIGFIGVAGLIIAGYVLQVNQRYATYLFMIHKKLVKAKNKHD